VTIIKVRRLAIVAALLVAVGLVDSHAAANQAARTIRETAEFVISKYGRGAAGQTVDEVAESTARAVAKHGDDALPLLRSSGHAGFEALERAGVRAPDVIRLYARRGDDAVWVISQPSKLAIFMRHGDDAADALLKYPGVADTLIERYGDDAVKALSGLSRSSAQRLGMASDEGLLAATGRSGELLTVIGKYGDAAMDFIWKNKGALAVASVLATFLADPEVYIRGAKELVVSPVLEPIARGTNWTLIISAALAVVFLPLIARSLVKARAAFKPRKPRE
jgi:hypothetical protein